MNGAKPGRCAGDPPFLRVQEESADFSWGDLVRDAARELVRPLINRNAQELPVVEPGHMALVPVHRPPVTGANTPVKPSDTTAATQLELQTNRAVSGPRSDYRPPPAAREHPVGILTNLGRTVPLPNAPSKFQAFTTAPGPAWQSAEAQWAMRIAETLFRK